MVRAMKRIIFGCVLMVMCSQAYAGAGDIQPVGDYPTLVYDGGGIFASIQLALTQLGVPYELRGPTNPVTAADLSSPYHNLLVVGCNFNGNMSGLPASVLEGGITGKKVITGHDSDYHYYYGRGGSGGYFGDSASVAAGRFLMQAMAFARGGGGGGGCGLLALGDYANGGVSYPPPFSYLPTSWSLLAQPGYRDTVSVYAGGAGERRLCRPDAGSHVGMGRFLPRPIYSDGAGVCAVRDVWTVAPHDSHARAGHAGAAGPRRTCSAAPQEAAVGVAGTDRTHG